MKTMISIQGLHVCLLSFVYICEKNNITRIIQKMINNVHRLSNHCSLDGISHNSMLSDFMSTEET